MKSIKTILFPTDFSECANAALGKAIQWASFFEAKLTIMHVQSLHDVEGKFNKNEFPRLNEVISHIKSLPFTSEKDLNLINFSYLRGISIPAVILEEAKKINADVIILGTHGRRNIQHILLGSVAEEVVRYSNCSVLTVRERSKSSYDVKNILVPIDFSDYAKTTLDHAATLAKAYSANLHILHIIEQASHPAFYLNGIVNPIFGDTIGLCTRSMQEIESLCKKHIPHDVSYTAHANLGVASVDIQIFAKDNDSDLIVMASHGLSGLEHFLIGSVTERVVRTAPCPVLAVRN